MTTDIVTPASRRMAMSPQNLPTRPSFSRDSFIGLAKPLLDLTAQIQTHTDLKTQQSTFEKRLADYVIHCEQAGYHPESCLIAQFIVASFIDATYAQAGLTTHAHTLSDQLSQGPALRQQFSKALDTLYHMPTAFIDLLELLFFCQSLAPGLALINPHEKNSLYRLIRETRGEADLRLSEKKPNIVKRTLAERTRLFILSSIVVTIVLLGGIFASFDIVLQDSQTTAQQHLTQLNKHTN